MTSLLSYFTPQNTPFLYRGTHFPFFFFWRVLPRIDPVATLSYLSPSTSTTQSSLESTMENKEGREVLKGIYPHQISCEALTFLPSPSTKLVSFLRSLHPLLLAFYNLTPNPSIPPQEQPPPTSSLNSPMMCPLHRGSLSKENLQHHL